MPQCAAEDCSAEFEPYRNKRFCSAGCRDRTRARAKLGIQPDRFRKRISTAQIVTLYRAGISAERIAKRLGIAKGTVLNRLHKAQEPIREQSDYDMPAGDRHYAWKGGRARTNEGYVRVWTTTPGPRTYQLEHRIIVERAIGRRLGREEYVHHLNGIRDDAARAHPTT